MGTQENVATFRRWMEEGWNEGKVEVVDELYAPEYVSHSIDPYPGNGEGLKMFVTDFRRGFPDLHFDLDDFIADGDKVALRFTGSGTQRDEFMGIPPTNKHFSVSGILMARFDDNGKWVEDWVAWDRLGMLQNLGVIPEAAPA